MRRAQLEKKRRGSRREHENEKSKRRMSKNKKKTRGTGGYSQLVVYI